MRNNKRGKLVSYFLNNAAKTFLYGLKISENIEIVHVFWSKSFIHFISNLRTGNLSAFKTIKQLVLQFCYSLAIFFHRMTGLGITLLLFLSKRDKVF